MISIGLTGGLASGKSLVARIFKSLGCVVIDTDTIARDVVVPGSEGWKAVVKEFGTQILTQKNTLDRPNLAGIIFADAGRRQVLNSILHPLIISSVRQQLAGIGAREPDAMVVVDVPLLIECGLQDDFDEVIVVWTPRETQIRRLMERDGLPEAEARQRLAAQLPLDQKRAYATFVVENDAEKQKTEAQVRRIFSDLKKGRGRR